MSEEKKEVLPAAPESDGFASEAEYQNHWPWCKARRFGRLNRSACNCDLKAAPTPEPEQPDLNKEIKIEEMVEILKGQCERATVQQFKNRLEVSVLIYAYVKREFARRFPEEYKQFMIEHNKE